MRSLSQATIIKTKRVFMLEIADMADKEKEWGFEDVLENEEVKS